MNAEVVDPTIVPDEPLLKARQVADRLNVHILTVRRWTRTGELPSVHLAKRAVRYRREDVYEFMRKHQTPKVPRRRKRADAPAPAVDLTKRDRGR